MNLARHKAFIVFLGLFFSINATSYSQTEKQIIEDYRQALKRAVDDDYIQSMELKGEFIIKKVNFPITIFFKLPNLFRMEMEFQSVRFIQLSNDSVKWEYNPLEDKSTVTRIGKTESNQGYKKSSTFDFVCYELLNYKEWNHMVKYKGKEKMDSLEVHVLELTNKSRKETRMKFYMDIKTNLLYKVEDEAGFRYFANYTDVDGYVFPKYLYDYKPDETLEAHFTKCVINKPIPDSLFTIPNDALEDKKSNNETESKILADADSLYNLGNMEQAEILYTRFIKQNSQSYRAFNSRGLVKISQKEYYDAIVDFNRALELEPTGVAARNNLGLAKFYLGDLEGAIKDYTKALSVEPTYVVSLKNRGHSYLQLKDYEKAISDFGAVTKLKPEDGEAHFKCGVALAQLEKYDDAMNSYRLALSVNYQTAEVYNYKGVTEYKTERYDSARVSFAKAVLMNADHLQYLENYGRTFYELGEYEKAIEQFEKYLKKKSDQPEIHNLIGLCKYKEENYKGAIKNFSKSIELDGKNAAYYDNRAAAKEMIEDYEGAITDYGESIRVYPNDASVFYKRGLIKLYTSKKIEGCLDLGTAHEMKYEPAKQAIFQNCN